MLEVFLRGHPAAGQQGVGNAHGGGVTECRADVKLIIFLQKAAVNDVEDVPPVFVPILPGKLGGHPFKLVGKAMFAGNTIAALQRLRHRGDMFLTQLP